MVAAVVSQSSSTTTAAATTMTTTDDDNNNPQPPPTIYEELISFLSSPRSDLRKAAAEATLTALTSTSHTNSNGNNDNNDAATQLTSLNVIQPLCKIASIGSQSTSGSNDALASLCILCSHTLVGNANIVYFISKECKGIGRMIELAMSTSPTPPSTAASIAALNDNSNSNNSNNNKLANEWNEWRTQINYACALLANATRDERGSVEFIGLSFPEEAVPSSYMRDVAALERKSNKGGEEEEEEDNDDNNSMIKKRDAKPTAMLLMSRFLNPLYIDTSSPGYKEAVTIWEDAGALQHQQKKKKKSKGGAATSASIDGLDGELEVDEYDSDLDIDALDDDDEDDDDDPSGEKELDLQKIEIINEHDNYDPYQHIAAVIMNIAQLESGRDFLMKLIHHSSSSSLNKKNNEMRKKKTNASSSSLDIIQEGVDIEQRKKNKKINNDREEATTSHLQSILPQLSSPNIVRRRGIAGTLKNCCFAKDSLWWLLHVVHMDKSLLMTLAGPEELTIDEKVGLDPDYWLLGPNKVREPNALVRLYVVEAVLLLLASGGRRSRETLRERRTYVIVKLADMVEENEQVSERLLECVQYLRRDEEGTEEGSSDKRAYEKYARGMLEMDGAKNKKTGLLALLPSSMSDDAKDVGDNDGGVSGRVEGDDEDYDNID